ncbi:dicarboxylate transporter [Pycnococcus provasolii]
MLSRSSVRPRLGASLVNNNNKNNRARHVCRAQLNQPANQPAAQTQQPFRSPQQQHNDVKLAACALAATRNVAAAATSNAVVAAAAGDKPARQGADMKKLGMAVAVGAVLWLIPAPAGVATNAWHLFAIFVSTIVGIITMPLPLGAVAMIGLGVAQLTKTLTFPQAFSAFSSEIPWLIAIAFFLARGFIKTGLGNRIAYVIVSIFGKTTLGLTYSLVFAEAILAPAIPSLAARAGGIFLPLCKALCIACGSDPEKGTEKRMGSYLMTTVFHTSCITSGMFITAMAANPLSVNLAAALTGYTITWGQWALAASVPCGILLVAVPLLLYIFYPPEVKDSPEAPAEAKAQLEKMGPMSEEEKIMAGSLSLTVALWVFGGAFGIGGVASALVGMTILMVTGVLTWKECLAEGPAWDTLVWFAALIAMANFLNKFGLIPWFSNLVVSFVQPLGLAWQASFLVVTLVYFYSHYLFASGAAHIGAMYAAFLSVALACGTPPLVAAIALGIVSNNMGCLTHYGIGSGPPFYGAGYVPLTKWWVIGGVLSVFELSVILGVGSVWWKLIGFY